MASLRHAFGVSTDEALYVLLAGVVRHGEFSYPGRFGFPITDPLPGYPLILSIPAWILEPHWRCFWILGFIPSVAALWLTWRLALECLDRSEAVLALGLTAVNAQLLEHAGSTLPDTAFLALSLSLFLGCQRAKSHRQILLLSVGAGLAALMRPQGFFLILALSALLGLQQGWRRATAFATLAFLPLGAWILRNHWAVGTVTGYADNWKDQVLAMAEAGGQWRHFLGLISVVFGKGMFAPTVNLKAVELVEGGCVLALASWGTVAVLRRRQQPLAFAVACYVIIVAALHATWPPLTPRYAVALAPYLWILAVPALSALSMGRPAIRTALAIALAGIALPRDAGIALGPLPKNYDMSETIRWIRSNTSGTAAFETLTPSNIELIAGRDALCPVAYEGRDAWIKSLLENKIEYVHFVSFLPDGLMTKPMIDSVKGRMRWVQSSAYFTRVYINRKEGTAVFSFSHPDPARFHMAWNDLVLGLRSNWQPGHEAFARRKLLEAVALEPTLALGWRALGLLERDPRARREYFKRAKQADPSLDG